MKIRPGGNLVRTVAVLAAISPVAFYWPVVAWAPALAAAVVAVLAVFDYRACRQGFRDLSIERSMAAVAGRDLPFHVELQIVNKGRMPFAGELRDQAPAAAIPAFQNHQVQLPSRGSQTIAVKFRIASRGLHEFGPVWLRLLGPWGTLEVQRPVPCIGRVMILPEGFSTSEGLRQDERAEMLLLDKAARARQTGVGSEFEMLSEYRSGDDPRRIDWRTTARCRRPVVRRFLVERHRDVIIVIDCGRLMGSDAGRGTKLDCAVDAALMLCRTVVAFGDRCGLALFDNQVLGYLPPISGARAVRILTESVYDIQSRWRESDFGLMFATLQSRQTKRSLVIILSDIVDVETSTRFRKSLANLARRHVVLFAGLQTPLLRETIAAPVATVLDGARKAVAFRILRERETALHTLRRSGVQVLDVEPSRLTVPLINQFIELRHQNVL